MNNIQDNTKCQTCRRKLLISDTLDNVQGYEVKNEWSFMNANQYKANSHLYDIYNNVSIDGLIKHITLTLIGLP